MNGIVDFLLHQAGTIHEPIHGIVTRPTTSSTSFRAAVTTGNVPEIWSRYNSLSSSWASVAMAGERSDAIGFRREGVPS
jgi:hypothetical protein